ncbi:MAG: Gfo/Idh/MocA family oxidoreductase [Herbinix sp.]|jgi:predicted dehydrogenase|nr:Gfo/Idh/MocA family oxidoreductase [Herbinix sp.]
MGHKLAIIGYGGMGDWHYRSVRDSIESIDVKGIYDVREEVYEKAEANGLYVYRSVEELIKDPEIDMVTIAVPNNFHKDYAIQCLRGGKHVICEKPVTMNAEELREIMAVAKETNRLFTIHQNRRWDRDYKIIQKILGDDTIGRPYYIESRVLGSGRAMHGWRGYKINGGGMVYDWGVHLFDQMLNLIDSPVVSVAPHLVNAFNEEVDDNFKALLVFENGISALIEVATNCFINLPRWHVCGTEGTAVIHDWECNGEIVTLANKGELKWENDIVYTAAGPTRTMAPRPDETKKKLPLPEVVTSWSDYYNNIVDVLDHGAELIVKPEQALRVMSLIDLIFEAARESKPVSCRI